MSISVNPASSQAVAHGNGRPSGANHGAAAVSAGALPSMPHRVLAGLAQGVDWVGAERLRRRCALTVLELVFPLLSVVAAAAIVYSGSVEAWSPQLLVAAGVLTLAKLVVGRVTGAFEGRWRFVGLRDAMIIVRSALIAGAVGLVVVQRLQLVDTSLRLVAADTSIYIVLACGTRLASRWLHEWGRRAPDGRAEVPAGRDHHRYAVGHRRADPTRRGCLPGHAYRLPHRARSREPAERPRAGWGRRGCVARGAADGSAGTTAGGAGRIGAARGAERRARRDQ